MLKFVFRSIRRFFKNLKWLCQARLIRHRLKMKDVAPLKDDGVTYMVLIPHADDEWIGCSRIIRKMKKVILVDMDMDGGDSPSIHSKRKEELQQISKKFNHQLLILKKNKSDELFQLVRTENPDYILVPFFYYWFQEHIMVMDLLEQSFKNEILESNILMYQVSVPIGTRWINRVMPMSKHDLKEKWNVFKEVYKTQLHLPCFRFAMHEHVNGFLSKSFAAEIFVQMTFKEWRNQKANVIEKALKDKEKILANLNNVKNIRAIVER